MFPGHYNPRFTRAYVLSQRNRVIAPVHQSTIEQEEDGDTLKYGSTSTIDPYPGYHGYTSRVQRLESIVDNFKPSQSKTLNFYRVSRFQSSSAYETKRSRLLKIPGVRDAITRVPGIEPLTSLSKPWYQEPLVHSVESMTKSNFNVSFITGMSKRVSTSTTGSRQCSQSDLEEALSPSLFHYTHHCLLPAPPDPHLQLVRLELLSDLVVCYYGSGDVRMVEGVLVGGASVMTHTLVVYHTQQLTYSISRYTVVGLYEKCIYVRMQMCV